VLAFLLAQLRMAPDKQLPRRFYRLNMLLGEITREQFQLIEKDIDCLTSETVGQIGS
jgi:hypothetical protein